MYQVPQNPSCVRQADENTFLHSNWNVYFLRIDKLNMESDLNSYNKQLLIENMWYMDIQWFIQDL